MRWNTQVSHHETSLKRKSRYSESRPILFLPKCWCRRYYCWNYVIGFRHRGAASIRTTPNSSRGWWRTIFMLLLFLIWVHSGIQKLIVNKHAGLRNYVQSWETCFPGPRNLRSAFQTRSNAIWHGCSSENKVFFTTMNMEPVPGKFSCSGMTVHARWL